MTSRDPLHALRRLQGATPDERVEPDFCPCGAPCTPCLACQGEGGTLDDEGYPHDCSVCHGFGVRCMNPRCEATQDWSSAS